MNIMRLYIFIILTLQLVLSSLQAQDKKISQLPEKPNAEIQQIFPLPEAGQNTIAVFLSAGSEANGATIYQVSSLCNSLDIIQSGNNSAIIEQQSELENLISIRQDGNLNLIVAKGYSGGAALLDIDQSGDCNNASLTMNNTGDETLKVKQSNGSNYLLLNQELAISSYNTEIEQNGGKKLIVEQNITGPVFYPGAIIIKQK